MGCVVFIGLCVGGLVGFTSWLEHKGWLGFAIELVGFATACLVILKAWIDHYSGSRSTGLSRWDSAFLAFVLITVGLVLGRLLYR